MDSGNKRFTTLLVIAGLLIMGLMAAYIEFAANRTAATAAAAKLAPTTPAPNQGQPSARVTNTPAPTTPNATPPEILFPKATTTDKPGPLVQFVAQKTPTTPAISLPKLTPDLFAFDTLPYDAPIVQFPLVLVGQRDLDWTKTVIKPTGGGISPPSTAVYGSTPPVPRPPTPQPVPPPPPPPTPHPVPTPGPIPPEVSTSGL